MKYYYTDPLAAAWMAKHFAFKFSVNPQVINEHFDLIDVDLMEEDFNAEATNGDEWLFYIHPDSVHLLEPQHGDYITILCDQGGIGPTETVSVVYISGLGGSHWVGGREYKWAESLNKKPPLDSKIIHRNGRAFMWPQTEE